MFRVEPFNNYTMNERPQISNDVIHHRDIKSRLLQSMHISNNLEQLSSVPDMNSSKGDSVNIIGKIIFEKSNIVVTSGEVAQLLLSEGLDEKDHSLWSEKIWESFLQKCIQPRFESSQSSQEKLELKIPLGEFHLLSQMIQVDEKSSTGVYFLLQRDSLNFNWEKIEGNVYIRLKSFESKDAYVNKGKWILKVNDHEESARIHDGKIVKTNDVLLQDNVVLLLFLQNEKNGENLPFPKTFRLSFSVYR